MLIQTFWHILCIMRIEIFYNIYKTIKVFNQNCKQLSFCFFTVIIDSKLSFDSHIFAKIKKANSIIAVFKKTFIKMTIRVFLNIYKGLIRPHLEFCNQTWYPQLKQNTQRYKMRNMSKKALKLFNQSNLNKYNYVITDNFFL